MTIQFGDTRIKSRVEQLLRSMTLAQKIGQMTQAERTTCSPQDVHTYHLGSVLSAAGSYPGDNRPEDWLNMCDDYWHASVTEDHHRVVVPILYGVDAVHGHSNVNRATIFPHNIGLGAIDDITLINAISRATAAEVLTTGVDLVFAPNLAVAQDYRWGRTYESFSQDPKRVQQLAQQAVSGLQQGVDGHGVLACVKHWVGDGGTNNGIDQGDTVIDWQELKQIHIPPYYAAIEAGAMCIMVSFSSWNGEKCHAHHHLLTKVLKTEMQFSGFLLSDMQGIDYLAEDFHLAVAQGVNAGIDMFMVPDNWRLFIDTLTSHVELGTVPITRIDDAVSRILTVKLRHGLFEQPAPSKRSASKPELLGSAQHRKIAREAVQKSAVLLKHSNGVLPLNKQQQILVCGQHADNCGAQCGGFTVSWQGTHGNQHLPDATSIWQGITRQSNHCVLMTHAELLGTNLNPFDVAVVVVGESPYAEGVGDIRSNDDLVMQSGLQVNGQLQIHQTDRKSLELASVFPDDLAAIKRLHRAGIPVVTVVLSGRPLLIDQELEHSDALVAAWLPGSEGEGIADLLFGQIDFSATLPFDWPQQTYPFSSDKPRVEQTSFTFGFGLSLTQTNKVAKTG